MLRLKANKEYKSALPFIVLGVVGLVISFGPFLVQPKATKVKSIHENPAPSSAKPSAKTVAAYNVPPTDPKYLAISSIGISNARVMRLGIKGNGQIVAPSNINDAGWYDGSAKPGQTGAMFIYGHVSSWDANGLFYNLKKLHRGDDISITRGDNKTFVYQVAATKVYPYDKVDMNEVFAPIKAKVPGLNLMTCTGKIIKGTSEFNERLVVFASLVSS